MTSHSSGSSRPRLDPTALEMRKIGYAMVDRIVDHLDSISDQRVAKRGTSAEYQALVDEPLPVEPCSIEECMEFFFDSVVPLMTRVNHPRFHAYIPCPSSFPAAIGGMLAVGTNPFVGSWLGGATLASLELTVLRWICELLQIEPTCAGIFTSGGSMANLIGIASARAKYGATTLEKGVVYISDEGHASLGKAAQILGYRSDQIRTVATDENFRLNISQLTELISQDRGNGKQPFLVAANAGTTNTGAIDDLAAIADFCQGNEIWFHVDAAYGGFAAMVPEIREQMNGLELADSITLDPHKWLYCPMGTGCAIVRESKWLEAAFSKGATYLKDLPDDEVNFLNWGPELSRPARALPVWMLLRSSGREQIVQQIQEDIQLANLAASLLEQNPKLEVDSARLSIVNFRHRTRANETESQRAQRDDDLIEATLEDGEVMISSTVLKGRNSLRFVVMNHLTDEAEVRRSVAKISELAT